jgi:hypothetical protein
MKKHLLLGLCLALTMVVSAQKIKHFEAYVTAGSGLGIYGAASIQTRYVAVMEDNSIYWFSKEQKWDKTPTTGLPAGYDVIAMDAYSKEDGGRLVIVLADGSIWWYSTSGGWKAVTKEGLPAGKTVIELSSYVKMDGTRYVAVLDDNSIFWSANGKPWEKVPLEGLPK